MKYFAQVNFVVEADNESDATQVQEDARKLIETRLVGVIEANADERVEPDEFGHAG